MSSHSRLNRFIVIIIVINFLTLKYCTTKKNSPHAITCAIPNSNGENIYGNHLKPNCYVQY